jgi:CBS domain containing-hemolysin-like protein
MPFSLIVGGAVVAALATLFFSTLSYALRDFSRPRLAERMTHFGNFPLFERVADRAADLIFVTAIGRLFANILVLICVLRLFHDTHHELGMQYLLSVLITGVITLFVSVAIPNAAAKYAGETFIAICARFLLGLRWVLRPVIQIMHFTDDLIRRATGAKDQVQPEQIEEEILSAVEEGAKEGIVDQQEREMIESVIEFRDTTAGEIMTPRPQIVTIELPAAINEVKQVVEESGHSRIPVFEDNLDHIVGILYARDLLHYLGLPPEQFDLRAALRPALYVPESKPLRHLLKDFRLQKVHLAIVLDEYGGAAGLVTIEDILEELVGDITDEHEPAEPAMLKRINDQTWEADARVYIDELNRVLGLSLPDDAGYDTLGGFVSTTLGRIPPTGATFDHAGVKYTVLDAEPQKVNRLRIELAPQPVASTREPQR